MSVNRLRPLLIAGLVVACSANGGQGAPQERGPGAETAEQAVRELVSHLNAAEFNDASDLAISGHAALASLAEGATFGAVADALSAGDADVAANFWSGFAQGTGSFLVGPVGYETGAPVVRDGIEFEVVLVNPPDGGQREVLVREEDGFRVDLFASFGAGVAPRMVQPVERLLVTETEEARLILSKLQSIVPSLLVAAERPGLPPDAVQGILRLVEVITRVG